MMADLASRIVGHYEKHAIAWDADRRNGYWNDKIWHDHFIARLGKGAKVLDLDRSRSTWLNWDCA
jgi:hypothetical protein